MAEEDEDDNTEGGEVEAKESLFAKHKKLIIMALIGLLLIGVSVGGTIAVFTLLNGEPEVIEGEEGAEGESAAAEEIVKPAIYYPLKPPILVSFDARGRQRLLQAEITLLTRDAEVVAAIELHMPMIRNALVLLIGGRTYEEVQTAEGKEFLRVECLQELQRILEQEIGKPGVEQVLFTGLVVQ
ncbi:MAG: flagellar basal body-associated FliL family protein [Agarilytica sp.]